MVIEWGGQIERERERERWTRNPSFFYVFFGGGGNFVVFFFFGKFRSSSSNSIVFPEINSEKVFSKERVVFMFLKKLSLGYDIRMFFCDIFIYKSSLKKSGKAMEPW